MYNFIFLLYSLAGERTVTVGECSSGDIAIFLIIPLAYEVYRGYIVFAFSVSNYVCLSVCLFVNFFSVRDFSETT